jgi:hypothetical protein
MTVLKEGQRGFTSTWGLLENWDSDVVSSRRLVCQDDGCSSLQAQKNLCTLAAAINPLTPELNPSVQRCLPRIFTGDFNF